MGASFCSEKPERRDFRDWENEGGRVEEMEWERGVLPSHGTDQTTAGWFHSSLASHSSHPPLRLLETSPSIFFSLSSFRDTVEIVFSIQPVDHVQRKMCSMNIRKYHAPIHAVFVLLVSLIDYNLAWLFTKASNCSVCIARSLVS